MKESKVCYHTECAKDDKSYTITMKNAKMNYENGKLSYGGDVKLTCTSAGKKEYNTNGPVKSWGSYVTCLDPNTFCDARFPDNVKGCDVTCNAGGRCLAEQNWNCWCYHTLQTKKTCAFPAVPPKYPPIYQPNTP